MATQENFNVYRSTDARYSGDAGLALSGMVVTFEVQHRFGGSSGIIFKTSASGNVTLTAAASGLFTVSLRAGDTSGMPFGAYAFQARNAVSGNQAVLTEGYMNLLPSVGD